MVPQVWIDAFDRACESDPAPFKKTAPDPTLSGDQIQITRLLPVGDHCTAGNWILWCERGPLRLKYDLAHTGEFDSDGVPLFGGKSRCWVVTEELWIAYQGFGQHTPGWKHVKALQRWVWDETGLGHIECRTRGELICVIQAALVKFPKGEAGSPQEPSPSETAAQATLSR